ncbi:ATP-dependent helicase HrpB [Sphingorhabdus pulchriflava]|uniref:ATP-dependent helicase HrpB n=1 Tax=Sphingorhabdus pulchriflava TaxID=2292257 RepID=A0A371BIG9_9SPHN|nr:ATP-dependent helicase HrpB [Sphingorhabdus pulchriflava]RDV07370.1 ATP-dependent helicase HrpB [Sphingorhabdus pulchriflava]
MTLPVEAVLSELKAALVAGSNAVLIAPPGAGKTTMVASALLAEKWCIGQILLLSPRRLAARAAAERIAELTGEPVGGLVGYATRMDSKQSAKTRILVLTEGIFRNRIQDDPELAGVSAVLFDEVHERSLDSDFGLALALDAQGGLRPDLRLVAMSATLDGGRFATLMGAPIVESEGKSWPLELRHIGRKAETRIEDEMAAAIRRALTEEKEGDVLAFLPGVAEIERTAERLEGISAETHRLHGSLDPAEQRAAIRKSALRKVILATSIAETSLTIDGVRIVVDSGLARRARYDRAAGSTRLVTERASQAAVTQRAGRAARQGPGVAYRLWEEAATAGMPPFDPPEILEADLSPLLLDCVLWGVSDPASLQWLDSPPKTAIDEARTRLAELEAIDGDGRPTKHGHAIARLPLPPRIAHMLVTASALGFGKLAAEVAVLLSERGLGGNDTDLERRLERWRSERGQRAEAARRLALRWSQLAPSTLNDKSEGSVAMAAALAFPDRIAKRRDASGENWLSVGGRGYRLDPAHPLAKEEWLAVADIQGAASGARILSAAAIDFAEIEVLYGDRIVSGAHISFDPATGGVRTESGRRLGAITLSKGQDAKADPEVIAAALLEGVREYGLGLLPWSDASIRLRERAQWAGVAGLSDAELVDALEMWLAPLLGGKRRLSELGPGALHNALQGLIGWDGQQAIDRLAPPHFASPAGTTHAIDYSAEGGPLVELRVQALFGLAEHPVIGNERTPLVLSLTSPAGRPIQTTRDLPGFWRGSWADVAKEMRGRYPKHNWPDDPTAAVASLKTKKAQSRT